MFGKKKKITNKKDSRKKRVIKIVVSENAKSKISKEALKKALIKKRLAEIKNAPDRPPFKAYKGKGAYVFVSYSHRNKKVVFKIIERLNQKGYRIWYDEGIEPGQEWTEEIGDAIEKCKKFLVFLSPSALESRNVKNEINLASGENKKIIAVLLKDTKLSSGMKLQLGSVQFIQAFKLTGKEFFQKLEQSFK